MQAEGELRVYAAADEAFLCHAPYYDDCRYLALSLHALDFNALFYDALGCPRSEMYVEGTDVHHHWERQRKRFEAAIPDLPQLARLWHAWEQVRYRSAQVPSLLAECRTAQKRASDPGAARFLQTLIAGCEQAQSHSEGVVVGGW